MSDVIDFSHQARQSRTEARRVYEDDWLLKLCGEWRACRAEVERNSAEYDIATMWATLPDDGIDIDTRPLNRMREIEDLLSAFLQPRTVQCARELLRVALTILAEQELDPDNAFAKGPVLEIVRNVHKALGEIDPAIVLRHGGKKRRARRSRAGQRPSAQAHAAAYGNL